MRIWTIEYTMKGENGVWSRERVVASDYLEAVEKANKLTKEDNSDNFFKKLRITKIEEEEAKLDSI